MSPWDSIAFWLAYALARVACELAPLAVFVAVGLLVAWGDSRKRKRSAP